MNIYEIPSIAHIQKKKKGEKKKKYQNGNSEIFREFPSQKKIKFQEILPIDHHWLSIQYVVQQRSKMNVRMSTILYRNYLENGLINII